MKFASIRGQNTANLVTSPGSVGMRLPRQFPAPSLQSRFVFVFDGISSSIEPSFTPPDLAGAFEIVFRLTELNLTYYFMSGPDNVNAMWVTALPPGNLQTQRQGNTTAASGVITALTNFKVRTEWDGASGSGAAHRLYLNDQLVTTGTVGTNSGTATTFIAKRRSGIQFMPGIIAEVKWFFGTVDPNATPAFYLKIDEGSGTVLTNSGSFGGTETLIPGTGSWVFLPP